MGFKKIHAGKKNAYWHLSSVDQRIDWATQDGRAYMRFDIYETETAFRNGVASIDKKEVKLTKQILIESCFDEALKEAEKSEEFAELYENLCTDFKANKDCGLSQKEKRKIRHTALNRVASGIAEYRGTEKWIAIVASMQQARGVDYTAVKALPEFKSVRDA